MSKKAMFFTPRGVSNATNFIIEGVSSLIATKDDLLTEMFNSTSAYYQGIVDNFTVDGDDVSFRLKSSEELTNNAWSNAQGYNTILESFLDTEGKITKIGLGVFNDNDELTRIHIPNVTEVESSTTSSTDYSLYQPTKLSYWHRFNSLQKVGNGFITQAYQLDYLELPELTEIDITGLTFNNLSGLKRCYMPKLSTIGYPSGNVRSFLFVPSSCVFYVNPALETSNGGDREQLIEYLEDTEGCTIVYIDNETPPNEVTDLATVLISSGSVVLSFSTPTSTNTVEFYEVWIDDGVTSWHKYFPKQHMFTSGSTLFGLTSSTNYDIKIVAVDEYYNKSGYSNTINITTT